MLYADDIVILAESEHDLQSSLDGLSKYCDLWKLSINPSKTKCIVFNRGNRLCNCKVYVKGNLIENVKKVAYLGFVIGAKNCNFKSTPENLAIKANRAIFALNNKIKLSRLPPLLSIKIFKSQITPILLYGSEIWGAYGTYDFPKWDKTITERTHTQFLKRILGCDLHTPNLMVRGEVGERPLLIDIILRSTLYVKQTAQNTGTLANIALDNELSLFDDDNIFFLARTLTPYYQQDTNYLVPQNKYELRNVALDQYYRLWQQALADMSKADTYRSLKTDISLEKYLHLVRNHKHRIALSRLRLSSHNLLIEKGRHQKPPLARSDRLCPFCQGEIENESHFVINCPLYEQDRGNLLELVRRHSSNFDQIPTDFQKFIFILSNEDPTILRGLSLFVYNAFKIRNQFLIND